MLLRRGLIGPRVPLLLVAFAACTGEPLPEGPLPTRTDFARGLAFVAWDRDTYGSFTAAASLAALAATGARWVAIVPLAYQDDPQATVPDPSGPRSPSRESVVTAIRGARALGLRVLLKPHVEVRDGTFRGRLAPRDRDAWFAAYAGWLVDLARLAEAEGAAELAVGTELASLSGDARWRIVVAAVRAVYRGPLTYAANWDELAGVGFWDALDHIGVDAYFPLTDRLDPTVEDLVAGWQPHLAGLERLARGWGRPVLITEVGLPSRRGAAARPWDWRAEAELDLDVQAHYYAAALRALSGAPFVQGLFFWAWNADGSGGPQDRGYTPQGKPAEAVLRREWGGG